MYEFHNDTANKIRWVLRAISKDEYRRNLTYLCVKDNLMICTDGKRMHIAPLENIEIVDGLYSVVVNKKNNVILKYPDQSSCGTFPNHEMVIPSNHKSSGFNVNQKTSKSDRAIALGQAYRQLNMAIDGGVVVNADYLKDAVIDSNIEWDKLHTKTNLDPVMFTSSEGHKAIVMPVRL